MRFKTTLQFIILTSSLFMVNTTITSADDDINLSPIVIVDSTQDQNGGKNLLIQQQTNTKSLQSTEKNLQHQNTLHQELKDNYSLALGANININDTFNIGAACGMPLINSEPIQIEDLSIEAMVSMQF